MHIAGGSLSEPLSRARAAGKLPILGIADRSTPALIVCDVDACVHICSVRLISAIPPATVINGENDQAEDAADDEEHQRSTEINANGATKQERQNANGRE